MQSDPIRWKFIAAATVYLLMEQGTSPIFRSFERSPTQAEVAEARRKQYVIAEQKAHDDAMWVKHVPTIATYLKVDIAQAEKIAAAVRASSEEFGVKPDMILRIIRVESAGNPDAVSRVGAIGLTQVMPATGKEIAENLGVEWEGPQMLTDAHLNVRFGTYYFRQLQLRFNSDFVALGAYNWGPSYVQECIEAGQPLPRVYPTKVLNGGPYLKLS